MLKTHTILWRVDDSDIELLKTNSEVFWAGIREISSFAFRNCKQLEHITIPSTVVKIAYDAFVGTNIKSITLESFVEINSTNLENHNLNYVVKPENSNNIIICKDKPLDKKTDVINLKKANLVIKDFNTSMLLKYVGFKDFKLLIKKLYRKNMVLNNEFVESLVLNNQLHSFASTADFTFIKNEIPNFKRWLDVEYLTSKNLLHFANAIGCFSTKKILNKEGVETQTILAQKASSFLAEILNKNILKISDFNKRFNFLYGSNANEDFFKFISQGKGEGYPNLKTLLKLDNEYPGILDKMLKTFNFKDIKRTTELKNKNKKLSWHDALKSAYFNKKYSNITDKTKEIAELFAKHNLSEDIFSRAVELKNKSEGVKEHILSVPLKEETVLESVEKLKLLTGKKLSEGKKNLDQIYEKEFTYEMLNKSDALNYIIGLYTNCCATIYSIFNGADIAKATILSENVQNIVIKDAFGEVVAKGALYINEKNRYGVINSLFINEKYRDNLKNCALNNDAITKKGEQKRQLIFDAFMRGINDFVKQYDKEHPNATIKKINVGLNNNSLYAQCVKFKKEHSALYVPGMYGFEDARDQRILYKKEKKLSEIFKPLEQKTQKQNNSDLQM